MFIYMMHTTRAQYRFFMYMASFFSSTLDPLQCHCRTNERRKFTNKTLLLLESKKRLSTPLFPSASLLGTTATMFLFTFFFFSFV